WPPAGVVGRPRQLEQLVVRASDRLFRRLLAGRRRLAFVVDRQAGISVLYEDVVVRPAHELNATISAGRGIVAGRIPPAAPAAFFRIAGIACAGDLAAGLERQRDAELDVVPPPLSRSIRIVLGVRIEPSDAQRCDELLRMAREVRRIIVAAEAERLILLETFAQRSACGNLADLLRLGYADRQRFALQPEHLVVPARIERDGLLLLDLVA